MADHGRDHVRRQTPPWHESGIADRYVRSRNQHRGLHDMGGWWAMTRSIQEGGMMTAEPKVPALDDYWGKLEPHLPRFSAEDQRAAVALYRELAKGKAVAAEQLGRALGTSLEQARALLDRDSIKV